jgi:H+/gluconate symporter-like permease
MEMAAGSIPSLLVLCGGLGLLMALVVRGRSIFVAAPACAAGIVAASGHDPVAALTGPFMTGFADYVRSFYLVFALGAALGRLYEVTGAADEVARHVGRLLGPGRAALAVVAAAAILTYGGVSLFVVGFSVYPLAVRLFRSAALPRRFIPAAIAFGSITFTMTSAGSPEIQNLIPIKYLVDAASGAPLTDSLAGWPVSIVVAGLMFAGGQLYLDREIRRAVARGETWEDRPDDAHAVQAAARHGGPSIGAAALPIVATLLGLNVLPRLARAAAALLEPAGPAVDWLRAGLAGVPEDPALAVFLGVATATAVFRRQLVDAWRPVGEGFVNGLLAIGATASIVGFGAAVKELPAFRQIVAAITSIPGDPLVGAAVAVAVIALISGSASGGQAIALPILKPIYIDQLGVAPRALHRVVSIASGSLDSLPANGYIVMLIRTICGETHARAYGPIFVLTVVIPALGTALAILLFAWFPKFGSM